MKVTVLRRGGLAVYGGSFDARSNEAVSDTANPQRVTVIFPEEIEAPELKADGLIATDLQATNNEVSFSISGEGHITLTVTMGDGQPAVRISTPRGQTRDYRG